MNKPKFISYESHLTGHTIAIMSVDNTDRVRITVEGSEILDAIEMHFQDAIMIAHDLSRVAEGQKRQRKLELSLEEPPHTADDPDAAARSPQ